MSVKSASSGVAMHPARRLQWLRIFALFGMIFSAFLLYQYYIPQPSSPCILGGYFICTLTDTPYARLDGIFHFLAVDLGLAVPLYSLPFPNALLTFLAFFFLFFIALHLQHHQPTFGLSQKHAIMTLTVIFYLLAAYTVYLTYVETYILYTFCLFCFAVTLLTFGSLLLLVGSPFSLEQQPSMQRNPASSRRKRR